MISIYLFFILITNCKINAMEAKHNESNQSKEDKTENKHRLNRSQQTALVYAVSGHPKTKNSHLNEKVHFFIHPYLKKIEELSLQVDSLKHQNEAIKKDYEKKTDLLKKKLNQLKECLTNAEQENKITSIIKESTQKNNSDMQTEEFPIQKIKSKDAEVQTETLKTRPQLNPFMAGLFCGCAITGIIFWKFKSQN